MKTKLNTFTPMNPALSHLPSFKQNELAEIVKIIREKGDPAK